MTSSNPVPDFTALRVAVVGDPIADHYLFARPTRMSREAPVMVMRHEREEVGTGGAANVARNLRAFGARSYLFGATGRDSNGRELLRLLEREEIDVAGVHTVPRWVTPTKTRILGAEPGRTMHQVLRIDREPGETCPRATREAVAEQLASLGGELDAVLISDYGYGMVGEEVARAVEWLRKSGVQVVLDPRTCFEPFHGATAMTPNLGELASATERRVEELDTHDAVTRAATELRERCAPGHLLVTMGNRGMALYDDEYPTGVTIAPAGSQSVVDVSGAGDTAAAAFTLALAAGLDAPRAMRLANAAAGVVVMVTGAATCPLSALRSALPVSPRPEFPSRSPVR